MIWTCSRALGLHLISPKLDNVRTIFPPANVVQEFSMVAQVPPVLCCGRETLGHTRLMQTQQALTNLLPALVAPAWEAVRLVADGQALLLASVLKQQTYQSFSAKLPASTHDLK